MKASEYLLAKAIENNDFELSKLASEIKDTDQDIEFLTKEASIFKGLLTAGKGLMSNNTVRNAAIGTGVGTIAGAATAEKGNRVSGALKGGLLGGVIGGGATAGKNIYKNYSNFKGLATGADGKLVSGVSKSGLLGEAFKTEGKNITGTLRSTVQDFRLGKAGISPSEYYKNLMENKGSYSDLSLKPKKV